ncbi:MAG: lipocalin-like domain-containing protein, partial [Chloroflexota bacterium]
MSIVVVVFGFSLVEVGAGTGVGAGAAVQSADVNLEDYPRAVDPNYDWNFPEDHGPHNDFLTEWWYYTGNVATADGRRFGFQFTIFRRAILPEDQVQDSEWRTRQMYLGHVTISDIAADEFYQEERYSRGAAGLAGATADPRYRVWLEDWEVVALNDDATEVHMVATAGNASMDIVLTQAKPIVFQGEQGNGLSFKGGEEGNASYYYSIPRLETEGTFTIGDETFEVTGNTWMDREFSTSALAEGAVGWDWFGLIFDDNTELMLYHIRLEDGSTEPASAGLYIDADGNYTYLHSEDYTMTPLDTWT